MRIPIIAELKILEGPHKGLVHPINVEEALWVRAKGKCYDADTAVAFRNFPGGSEARRRNDLRFETTNGMENHCTTLIDITVTQWMGEHNGELPWRNTAPEKIGEHPVTYHATGIKVGCREISKDQLKAMLEKIEEQPI